MPETVLAKLTVITEESTGKKCCCVVLYQGTAEVCTLECISCDASIELARIINSTVTAVFA